MGALHYAKRRLPAVSRADVGTTRPSSHPVPVMQHAQRFRTPRKCSCLALSGRCVSAFTEQRCICRWPQANHLRLSKPSIAPGACISHVGWRFLVGGLGGPRGVRWESRAVRTSAKVPAHPSTVSQLDPRVDHLVLWCLHFSSSGVVALPESTRCLSACRR